MLQFKTAVAPVSSVVGQRFKLPDSTAASPHYGDGRDHSPPAKTKFSASGSRACRCQQAEDGRGETAVARKRAGPPQGSTKIAPHPPYPLRHAWCHLGGNAPAGPWPRRPPLRSDSLRRAVAKPAPLRLADHVGGGVALLEAEPHSLKGKAQSAQDRRRPAAGGHAADRPPAVRREVLEELPAALFSALNKRGMRHTRARDFTFDVEYLVALLVCFALSQLCTTPSFIY